MQYCTRWDNYRSQSRVKKKLEETKINKAKEADELRKMTAIVRFHSKKDTDLMTDEQFAMYYNDWVWLHENGLDGPAINKF